MVSLARIVWGQAGGVAMEVARGVRGVQPSVRPFDPGGSQGAHSGLDAGASEQCNGQNAEQWKQTKQINLIPQSLRT